MAKKTEKPVKPTNKEIPKDQNKKDDRLLDVMLDLSDGDTYRGSIEGIDRPTKYVALDGRTYHLSIKQRKFCEYYLMWNGNGVEAIISAGYDCNYKTKDGQDTGHPNRKLASVMSSENLAKPSIYNFIALKMQEYGFTDDNVTKQHLFLLNQLTDLSAKSKAIDMFYKIRGTYAPEKQEHTVNEKIERALDKIASILPD